MKYVHNIVNPILDARMKEGYSLRRLGKRLDLSGQYISRAEQGTYSLVNQHLVNYVANVLEKSEKEVLNEYRKFQEETRIKTATNIAPDILKRGLSRETGNIIFSKWRSDYWHSSLAFSNGFCLHPEIAKSYEEGLRSKMPDQIRYALTYVKLLDPNWSDENN